MPLHLAHKGHQLIEPLLVRGWRQNQHGMGKSLLEGIGQGKQLFRPGCLAVQQHEQQAGFRFFGYEGKGGGKIDDCHDITRGEEHRPIGRSFSATIQGCLRHRINFASLDLALKDEACA